MSVFEIINSAKIIEKNGHQCIELNLQAWKEVVEKLKQLETSVENSKKSSPQEKSYSLRGTPLQYHNPLDPVAESDWTSAI